MMHNILIFLEYTLPGLVIAAFAVWLLWRQVINKKQ